MIEEQLTLGEKLFLRRRREKISQAEMARRYSVSRYTYMNWEKNVGGIDIPSVDLKGITPTEHFVILRRRAGISQLELAARMGIDRKTLWQMENGHLPLRQLIEFWCE